MQGRHKKKKIGSVGLVETQVFFLGLKTSSHNNSNDDDDDYDDDTSNNKDDDDCNFNTRLVRRGGAEMRSHPTS